MEKISFIRSSCSAHVCVRMCVSSFHILNNLNSFTKNFSDSISVGNHPALVFLLSCTQKWYGGLAALEAVLTLAPLNLMCVTGTLGNVQLLLRGRVCWIEIATWRPCEFLIKLPVWWPKPKDHHSHVYECWCGGNCDIISDVWASRGKHGDDAKRWVYIQQFKWQVIKKL